MSPRESSPSPCIWEALAREGAKGQVCGARMLGRRGPSLGQSGEMILSGQGRERAEHSGSNNVTILHNRLLKAL